jgi:ribosomal protein S18 acetylase RimI-like enzyme
MPFMVRPATLDDLTAIVAVHVAGFRAGNVPHLPPDGQDTLNEERAAAVWDGMLAAPPPGAEVLVATGEAGDVVGLACAGRARDHDVAESSGELYALYVDPEAWGQGHGRALDTAARAHLRGALFTSAVLWVLEGNEGARAFYERCGWHADGGRREHAGAIAVRYRVGL